MEQAASLNHLSSLFFMSPKSNSEMEEDKRAHENYKHTIQTLPLIADWKAVMFRNFNGFWFPEPLLPGIMAIHDNKFKPKPTDILLVTTPKAGTTLLKSLAFAVANRPKTIDMHPQDCAPFLDQLFAGERFPNLDVLPDHPRLLATHMPYSLLPDAVKNSSTSNGSCKIVYLSREPKDVLVSMWKFGQAMKFAMMDMNSNQNKDMDMEFNDAFELFCKGESAYGPIWEHQLEYWEQSKESPDKVMFMKFEDFATSDDMEGNNNTAAARDEVRRLAEFMNVPFTEEEEKEGVLEEIVKMCGFERMKAAGLNSSSNDDNIGERGMEGQWMMKDSSFFRKGKAGGWRELMTDEMALKMDEITKMKLQGSGLDLYPIVL